MHRFGISLVLFVLAGCPQGQRGARCNPLEYSNNGVQGDCADGLACVFPTTPTCGVTTCCGVSYCCVTDANGKITDNHPNCQTDTGAAAQCMLDLRPPDDAGK